MPAAPRVAEFLAELHKDDAARLRHHAVLEARPPKSADGLHRHAEEHGHLCLRTRSGDRVRIPARWPARERVEQSRAAAQ